MLGNYQNGGKKKLLGGAKGAHQRAKHMIGRTDKVCRGRFAPKNLSLMCKLMICMSLESLEPSRPGCELFSPKRSLNT